MVRPDIRPPRPPRRRHAVPSVRCAWSSAGAAVCTCVTRSVLPVTRTHEWAPSCATAVWPGV
eukprot:3767959-Pleurochrysis_carterae.AAC.1